MHHIAAKQGPAKILVHMFVDRADQFGCLLRRDWSDPPTDLFESLPLVGVDYGLCPEQGRRNQ